MRHYKRHLYLVSTVQLRATNETGCPTRCLHWSVCGSCTFISCFVQTSWGMNLNKKKIDNTWYTVKSQHFKKTWTMLRNSNSITYKFGPRSLFRPLTTTKMTSGHEWKSLSGNYEDFQRELDNTASGVEFINQMMKEFHQIEVRLF